ncbi:MAG: histidine triad nucleotide-binding protein [Ruminococcus sp.]
MEDCLFCKIAAGEIPSTKVYEDETVYVFKDIAPIAPVHYLLIPKEHICCAAKITAENSAVVAHIYEVAAMIAEKENLTSGYRIVTNCGADAGQTVFHLHFHMLAGVKMGWGKEFIQASE